MLFQEEVEQTFTKDELFSMIDTSFPFQLQKEQLENFLHFWRSLEFSYEKAAIENFEQEKILERTLTPIKKKEPEVESLKPREKG